MTEGGGMSIGIEKGKKNSFDLEIWEWDHQKNGKYLFAKTVTSPQSKTNLLGK